MDAGSSPASLVIQRTLAAITFEVDAWACAHFQPEVDPYRVSSRAARVLCPACALDAETLLAAASDCDHCGGDVEADSPLVHATALYSFESETADEFAAGFSRHTITCSMLLCGVCQPPVEPLDLSPAVVSMHDQAVAAAGDLHRILTDAGIDVVPQAEAGPVARAVTYRMQAAINEHADVCAHVLVDRATPAVWYGHWATAWKCTDCHGDVATPEVCDHCGAGLDIRHVVAFAIPPVVTATAVNPPVLVVLTLCGRCAAKNGGA